MLEWVSLPVLVFAKAEDIIADDREHVRKGDHVLLILDDDPHYARVLVELARDKGFEALVTHRERGAAAIALAGSPRPTAITLDVFLPDMLGWTVLNSLSSNPATHHVPVQVLSMKKSGSAGSHTARSRPWSSRPPPKIWITRLIGSGATWSRIADGSWSSKTIRFERDGIVALLDHDDIAIDAVGTGIEALELMQQHPFDCCVVDLRLPDMTGFELLERMRSEPALRDVPVVVFTGKELSSAEEGRLKAVAKSVVLKDVQSPERLFDETALFLHRVVAELPPAKRQLLERLHRSNEVLQGRKVLVVDDDARNIFALTTVLENQDMEVLTATNGRQAIELIRHTSDLERRADGHHDARDGWLRNDA